MSVTKISPLCHGDLTSVCAAAGILEIDRNPTTKVPAGYLRALVAKLTKENNHSSIKDLHKLLCSKRPHQVEVDQLQACMDEVTRAEEALLLAAKLESEGPSDDSSDEESKPSQSIGNDLRDVKEKVDKIWDKLAGLKLQETLTRLSDVTLNVERNLPSEIDAAESEPSAPVESAELSSQTPQPVDGSPSALPANTTAYLATMGLSS